MVVPAAAHVLDTPLFSEVLTEVLTELPYNSAAQFHEYYGDGPTPARLGVACAWQSFEAGRMVADRSGVTADYRVGGRHVSALYDDGEALTVLDPYLLHREPLVFRRADAVDGVVRVESPAYPERRRADGSPAPSRVRALWRPGDHSLRLQYLRHSPRRDEEVTHRAYTMRAGATVPRVPPPAGLIRRLLLHPEQNNLSLRAVHREDHQLREVVLPFSGRPRSELVGREHLIARDNQGVVSRWGSAAFDRELEALADAVRGTGEEIVAHLLEAARLYDQQAPTTLAVPEYPVEDA